MPPKGSRHFLSHCVVISIPVSIQTFALLFLSICVAGCGGGSGSPTSTAKPPKVVCVAASAQQVSDFDVFIGRTQASEAVDVRARVSGFLRSVEFEDGAFVATGDLLATIEPEEYQAIHDQSLANVEVWKAKLELASTKFERSKQLVKQSAISQEEYDQDFAALKEAEAQVVAAEADAARSALDLEYTKVHAPIAGKTDRILITRGNLVNGGIGSGTLLTRIVKDDPIFAYLDVDEQTALKYFRKAQAKQAEASDPATTEENDPSAPDGSESTTAGNSVGALNIPCFLQLQDEDDFSREGKLDFIENKVDNATGTIQLRARFDNKDGLLRGGLFVRAKIPTSKPYTAVLIPEQAIGVEQGERFAFVVTGNKAERRTLSLGEQREDMRIILEGIEAGETVVTQGIQRLRPGIEVEVLMQQE